MRFAALRRRTSGSPLENVVIGAGADELILLLAHTFLGPGSRASIQPPTYALYRIATQLRAATVVGADDPADLYWRCNPNNPTGEVVEPEELVELARRSPDCGGRRRRGVCRVRCALCGAVGRRASEPRRSAHALEGVRVRRAPCRLCTRSPGHGSAPRRASRSSLDLGTGRAHRGGRARRAAAARPRADDRRARACACGAAAAGHDAPPVAGQLRLDPHHRRLWQTSSSGQGIVVRGFDGGDSRHGPAADRERRAAARSRRRAGCACRSRGDGDPHHDRDRAAADADDRRHAASARVATGIGFLDHLLTLFAFHAGVDLELLAGGDLDVDEHHLVEDVLAALGAALREALGGREGVTRYGSAVVPMDEAQASAAVDLVRRPHAEIRLTFRGDRVGALAPSLAHPRAGAVRDRGGVHGARRVVGRRRPPCRRGGVQGARPGAPRGSGTRRRRDPLDEGGDVTALRVVLADYGAGNLRSVTSAFTRAGADPVVTVDPETVARGAAGSDRRSRPRRECRARPRGQRARRSRPSAPRAPAGRPSASASGCNSCSRTATRAAVGSGCSPAQSAGFARAASRTWAGTRSRRVEATGCSTASTAPTSTSRTALPPSPARR